MKVISKSQLDAANRFAEMAAKATTPAEKLYAGAKQAYVMGNNVQGDKLWKLFKTLSAPAGVAASVAISGANAAAGAGAAGVATGAATTAGAASAGAATAGAAAGAAIAWPVVAAVGAVVVVGAVGFYAYRRSTGSGGAPSEAS